MTAGLRITLGLTFALTLLTPAPGPVTPARAEESLVPARADTAARIQVVLKSFNLSHDLDWGAGDVSINVRVYGGCPIELYKPCQGVLVDAWVREFQAADNTITQLDRKVPAFGDTVADPSISGLFGIPIRTGEPYRLFIDAIERDPSADDKLGDFLTTITSDTGELRLGTFTGRSLNQCHVLPIGHDFCSIGEAGTFTMEYEVRAVDAPDLRPIDIKIHDLPGSTTKLVCPVIQNAGNVDAGAFEVALKVDGVVPPRGKARAGRQFAGATGELCVDIVLPATGQYKLEAVVDEIDEQIEYNETNNTYSQTHGAANAGPGTDATTGTSDGVTPDTGAGSKSAQPAGPSSTPPSPSPTQADLAVSAIKVNGRVPDGKDDCKDGKNTVTVVVKNVGTGTAGAFAVRLEADGDEVSVESVDGLEAGQEREVRFEGVRLKKGEHLLTATVDAKKAVAESNEENNERKAAARCKDDN